ncbi:hypothetical protein LHJ74_24645 [Streptomyces sp. N2-109]|uniref:Large integral membrane protein n=1 Tax=Streptomyces gossypii TaxID=2883101 RepID=A0ABT2JYU5_9ACTN|nr:hypothetical protein [Streptomyces gossypii]MCT2593060.1 hypothetical protein [Streptomyces gossypii]
MTERTRDASPAWKSRLPAGIGLLLVLVSIGLSALVAVKVADIREYETAPACPTGTRSDSCTATAPGVVKGTENQSTGRGQKYWLLLTEQDSATVQRIRMDGHRPVYDAVRVGDKVTLTYWQGEISTVRLGSAAQEAWASPANDWRFALAFALMLLPFGLMLLATGWWVRYRAPFAKTLVPWGFTTAWGAGATLSTLGCVAGMMAGSVREALVVMAAAVPPSLLLGLLLAWWLRRRMRKAADTSDIVPVHTKKRRCVPASVQGDVPYSVDGFSYLVVGDGPPATTPDPSGHAVLRALPETLTVERVRSFQPGDPDTWMQAHKLDGIVIECRDGDRPVLIATRRGDAPMILGALTSWPMRAA